MALWFLECDGRLLVMPYLEPRDTDAAQALPRVLHVQSWEKSMTHKTLARIACVAIACAAGSVSAQGTGSATSGSSATSSDRAASGARQATSNHRSAAKGSTTDTSNPPTATPS